MGDSPIAPRLAALPVSSAAGIEVRLAIGLRARLLGLALLDRSRAGNGLLIPRCAVVHTFGMRFDLDLVFLDSRRRPLSVRRAVPPRMLAGHRGADAVLELPAVLRAP
jgi:uncharacterized membrane protein (UPF0127 family)